MLFFGPDGNQSVALFLGNGQMLETTETGVAVSPGPDHEHGSLSEQNLRLIGFSSLRGLTRAPETELVCQEMAVLTPQHEDFPRWYQDLLTKAKPPRTVRHAAPW